MRTNLALAYAQTTRAPKSASSAGCKTYTPKSSVGDTRAPGISDSGDSAGCKTYIPKSSVGGKTSQWSPVTASGSRSCVGGKTKQWNPATVSGADVSIPMPPAPVVIVKRSNRCCCAATIITIVLVLATVIGCMFYFEVISLGPAGKEPSDSDSGDDPHKPDKVVKPDKKKPVKKPEKDKENKPDKNPKYLTNCHIKVTAVPESSDPRLKKRPGPFGVVIPKGDLDAYCGVYDYHTLTSGVSTHKQDVYYSRQGSKRMSQKGYTIEYDAKSKRWVLNGCSKTFLRAKPSEAKLGVPTTGWEVVWSDTVSEVQPVYFRRGSKDIQFGGRIGHMW